MSVSNQPTPSSPTPSKSSLRRISGVQNTSARNLVPSPSPRFEDQAATEVRYSPRSPPNQTLDFNSDASDSDNEEEGCDPLVVPHAHDETDFPPAQFEDWVRSFQPLFTLIEDSVTSEHYHPSVHYIFADDDHEIVTEAAVRSIGEDNMDDLIGSSTTASTKPASQDNTAYAEVDAARLSTNLLPPSRPGINDHFLIVDVSPIIYPSNPQSPFRSLSQVPLLQSQPQTQNQSTAQQFLIEDSPSQQASQHRPSTSLGVSRYISLSPDWQITSASMTAAPTMSDLPDSDEDNLMLRIEGRGISHLESLDVDYGGARKRAGSNAAPGLRGDVSSGLGRSDKQRDQEKGILEDMVERVQMQLVEIRRLIDVDAHQRPPQQGILLTSGLTRDGISGAEHEPINIPDQVVGAGHFDEQD